MDGCTITALRSRTKMQPTMINESLLDAIIESRDNQRGGEDDEKE